VRVAQLFAEVVAVDTSQGMVDAVRAKAEKDNVQNLLAVKQAVASGDDLAPYGFFDVAIIVLTLHHIKDAQGILNAMASRLAPGGNLIVVDFASDDDSDFHATAGVNLEEAGVHHANGFSQKLISDMLASSGLEVISATSPFGMKVAWMGAAGNDDNAGHGHSHGGQGHGHSHGGQGHGHSHGGHGHGHRKGAEDPNAEFPLVFAVAAKK
jgi:SAM-dependent methyltransferase